MKSKIILVLGLAGSVLLERYLLTPSEQASLQNSTTITKVESTKPIQPKKMSWLNSNETNLDLNIQSEIKEEKFTLENIENCPECLQKLKNKLLHGNLKDLEKFANEIAQTNNPNLAILLAQAIDKVTQSQRRNLLFNALQKFNSPEIAKTFAEYLVSEQKISDNLRFALTTNINQTTNREQVKRDLMELFNSTATPEIKNQLLALDYPEMLAQVSNEALTNNDLPLFNQAKEQLLSNPYDTAPDALLSLKDSLSPDELQQVLNTWMERQGSGTRLDFIGEKFAQGNYSPDEQTMMLEALTHSENVEQGANIIAKFSNTTRH